MATMTAQAFNRDVSAAKRLAEEDGPLFITHRDVTKFVMMTIEDYEQMKKPVLSVADVWIPKDDYEIDIDLMDYIPPRVIEPERDVDLDW